jgi:hypothetical protein
MTEELWYRYEDRRYAPPVNEWDEIVGRGTVEIKLREFRVLKHTPKGVWLEGYFGGKRFVLNDAYRRYACPTIEEAKVSFRARKAKQISIYKHRIEDAEEALRLVNRQSLTENSLR